MNLLEDVDTAGKRRFTEVHELHRLSSEDNERFIRQYLDDVGVAYDLKSVHSYASEIEFYHIPCKIISFGYSIFNNKWMNR